MSWIGKKAADVVTSGQQLANGTVTPSKLSLGGPSWDASGNLVVPANISPVGNIVLASGKGIDFSASSNAGGMTSELLDDYETGTFTATLNMNSNPATTNSSSNTTKTATARYTKIGNVCTFDVFFDVSAYPGYVAFYITGLPFTSFPNTDGYPISIGHIRGVIFRYNTDVFTSFTASAAVVSNDTKVILQTAYTGSSYSGFFYMQNDSTAAGKYIHVGGSYRTA